MVNIDVYEKIFNTVKEFLNPILEIGFTKIELKYSEFEPTLLVAFDTEGKSFGDYSALIVIPELDVSLYKNIFIEKVHDGYEYLFEVPYIYENEDGLLEKRYKMYDFAPIIECIESTNDYNSDLSIDDKTLYVIVFLICHEFGHIIDSIINSPNAVLDDISNDLLRLFPKQEKLVPFDERYLRDYRIIKNEISMKKANLTKNRDSYSDEYYFKNLSDLDYKYREVDGEKVADTYAANILDVLVL